MLTCRKVNRKLFKKKLLVVNTILGKIFRLLFVSFFYTNQIFIGTNTAKQNFSISTKILGLTIIKLVILLYPYF